MVKNETLNLVKEGRIKQPELHNYISEKAPTSGDVYKIMVVDGGSWWKQLIAC